MMKNYKLMYEIKFSNEARYENILYETRDEAKKVGTANTEYGGGFKIRAVRVGIE